MILKQIKLKNIRSYNDCEVNFPEGSTLLSGDIGSGKTTILMGIEFALFGLQPGQKGSSLLKNGHDEGLIELEFELEGKPVILKRTLKRGKSVTQDSASIIINGEEKEMPITDLKNHVLNLLNYPLEFAKKTNLLYKFTVYTPQEEMKQIILEDPETRLNTLRYIFGVDKYKRIRENTLLFGARLREQIRTKDSMVQDIPEKSAKIIEKENMIKEIFTKVREADLSLSNLKEDRKKAELSLEELDKKIEEKRTLEKESEKSKVLITGKKETLLSLSKEEEYVSNQLKEIELISFEDSQPAILEKQKNEKQKEEEILRKEFSEICGIIASLNIKVQDIDKLKKELSKLQLCPTCLQNVDNEYRENVVTKLDLQVIETRAKVEDLFSKKSTLISSIDQTKKEILDIEKKYHELQIKKLKLDSLKEKRARIEDIRKSKEKIVEDIQILDTHFSKLKESLLVFANIDYQYRAKRQEFDLSREKEKRAEIKIAELQKEIEFTQNHIAELQREIKEKERIKKELKHFTELEQWMSEEFLEIVSFIEKNIMLKLREEFSKLFNKWFSLLVQDSFVVRLDEDFTPVIEQQDYELDYSYLSGGERTAVALAYRLALCQVINSMLSSIKTRDIIILDEPTDGFSEQQLDKMRDIFQQLKVKQLLVVSHEQKIEGFVDNIVRCKKENGITSIES